MQHAFQLWRTCMPEQIQIETFHEDFREFRVYDRI